MFWALVTALGFLREKLPVYEGNKLSPKVSEDYPAGPEGCVLLSAFPYYVGF